MKRIFIYLSLFVIIGCADSPRNKSKLSEVDSNESRIILNPSFYRELARIKYSYQGCFGGDEFDIVLYTKGFTTYASEVREYKTTRVNQISEAQIDSFDHFFKDLQSLDLGGLCTTTEQFQVFYKKELVKKTNSGCDWKGFSNLRKSLFGTSD